MVEERVQRGSAAILAADMVDYNQTAEDEAGALARLKGIRADSIDPMVTEQASRIFRGLGLLAAAQASPGRRA